MTVGEACSVIGSVSVVVGGIVWVVSKLTARPQCGEHVRMVKDIDDLKSTDTRIFNKIDNITVEIHAVETRIGERFDQLKDLLISRLPK